MVMDAIRKEIILDKRVPEWLVAVPPEITYSSQYENDLADIVVLCYLVYRYEEQIGRNKYLYTFSGCRLSK